MLVIVARGSDPTAIDLADRWGRGDVGILTPADLGVAGWRQHLGTGSNSPPQEPGISDMTVIERRLIPQLDITGVLTRLPAITADDLDEIEQQDREYVAAEMTAFMLFWLTRLKCPVINRPTPISLSGPYWRPEKWAFVAAGCGIKTQPVQRHSRAVSQSGIDPGARAAVTVIGERCFGDVHRDLGKSARRLARIAGAAMLTVYFSGPDRDAAFVSADSFPALDEDSHKDAALDYLCASPQLGASRKPA